MILRYFVIDTTAVISRARCAFWHLFLGQINVADLADVVRLAMPARATHFQYGPQEAVGTLLRPHATAVLVLRDGYHVWENPGFARWLQVTFMDMPCNARERLVCRVGALFGWDARRLERWADLKWVQIWRGDAFPFRPFLPEHARLIDAWIRECLADPSIDTISIHCVYGKNRSRAVWRCAWGSPSRATRMSTVGCPG